MENNEKKTTAGDCLLNPDGSIKLRNPHIEKMENDILYHLALESGTDDLVAMFEDVKFICIGGTAKRMKDFAHYIMGEIGYNLPTGCTFLDISRNSYRYAMYKVGPVLSISHGMGSSSVSIILHEIIKLVYHAKMIDPVIIRIGTCGGLGLESGTVVVTEDVIDPMLNHSYSVPILGKIVKRPAILDRKLVETLKALADPENKYLTTTGKTMCTSDFYEEQTRLDGAFCDYEEKDKSEFLTKLYNHGVVNIEMESLPIAAFTHHAGIRAAIVCVTLLDRLKGDQITATEEVLTEWQTRPQKLVARYIKSCLEMNNPISNPLLKWSRKSLLSTPSRQIQENYVSDQAIPSSSTLNVTLNVTPNVTPNVTGNVIGADLANVIISLLQGLKQTQDQNTRKIDSLYKLLNENHKTTNLVAQNPLPLMPLQNAEDFHNMESYLKTPENYSYFINRLSIIGGTDVRNSTMNVLKYILTDKLASCYNWAGRKSTADKTAEPKIPFKTTLIMTAISDSIKMAYSKLLPPDLNDQNIYRAVKDWLKLAPQRFNNKSTTEQNVNL